MDWATPLNQDYRRGIKPKSLIAEKKDCQLIISPLEFSGKGAEHQVEHPIPFSEPSEFVRPKISKYTKEGFCY